MKLYHATGACSLADRIMLHEAALAAAFERVDLRSKLTEAGADFRTINPKGYVPALVLDNGEIVTENLAVLFWIAGQAPGQVPPGPLGPVRLLAALAFISTEVHKPAEALLHPGGDRRGEGKGSRPDREPAGAARPGARRPLPVRRPLHARRRLPFRHAPLGPAVRVDRAAGVEDLPCEGSRAKHRPRRPCRGGPRRSLRLATRGLISDGAATFPA